MLKRPRGSNFIFPTHPLLAQTLFKPLMATLSLAQWHHSENVVSNDVAPLDSSNMIALQCLRTVIHNLFSSTDLPRPRSCVRGAHPTQADCDSHTSASVHEFDDLLLGQGSRAAAPLAVASMQQAACPIPSSGHLRGSAVPRCKSVFEFVLDEFFSQQLKCVF